MTSRVRIPLGAAAAALVAAGLAACSTSPTAPTAASAATATPGSSEAVVAEAQGWGNSPYRLTQAGWSCENVPMHGVHCLDPHATPPSLGQVHIQVKVFDTEDQQSTDAPFLGTESLVRADRYQGQPCLPGHGQYFLLPFGYYACHHFDF